MGNNIDIRDEPAKSIFLDAQEIASPEARAAYLDRRCGADEKLRGEVETLLRHHSRLGDYLEHPACDPGLTQDVACHPSTEGPGSSIGPYKLLEQIGEGGMGVVFMAEQSQPVRRKVALKIIKPGMDTKHVIARFEAERQALALMDHPSIARVLEAGATDSGRPYFVMELVRGIPITAYCDQDHLSIPDRLDLFIQVCKAVQHAHQKGIIHRDIKPSNVLITLIDGTAVPKVIDFGVAKATGQQLTEKTLFTAYAQMVGTPLYMSPEQAALSGLDIDTRSDIYSLGVLLYELLTGTTPFDAETFRTAAFDEVRRIIREDEPPRPSTRLSTPGQTQTAVSINRHTDARKLNHAVQGELDWIVMKALEKDRRRRYETANDFAADVQRHLTDQPVEACPPSAWYRFAKFARRNRTAMTTAALFTAAIGIGLVTSIWFAVAATKADQKSHLALAKAKTSFEIAEAQRAEAVAQEHETKALLSRSLIGGGTQQLDKGSGLGLFDLVNAHAKAEHDPKLREAAARLWAAGVAPLEGRLVSVLEGGLPMAFCTDGTLMATTSGESVNLWETATWRRRGTPLEHGPGTKVTEVVFSPDGSLIATSSLEGGIRLWDVATGRTRGSPLREEMKDQSNISSPLAFNPDGKRLSCGLANGQARIWNTVTGEAHGLSVSHAASVNRVAFSPKGAMLATGSSDATARLWDVETTQPVGPPLRQEDVIHEMAFSPDGTLLVTSSGVCKTRLWEVPSGRLHCEPLVTDGWVTTLEFSPDGRLLATGSSDWAARLWETSTGHPRGEPMRHDGRVVSVRFSPDGRLLATCALGGLTRLWEVETQKLHGSPFPESDVQASAFSPDGKLLALGGGSGTRVWQVNQRQWTSTFAHGNPVWAVDLSPDGKRLATASGSAVRVWDVETGSCRVYPLSGVSVNVKNYHLIPSSVMYSPDGALLAVIDSRTTVRLLDAVTCRPVGRSIVHPGGVQNLAFSTDGRRLATSSDDSRVEPATIRLWETQTQALIGTLPAGGICLEMSPDGRQVAVGTRGWRASIWGLADGFKLEREIYQGEWCLSLGYSADGSWLATGTGGGCAYVWDTSTGGLRGTALRFDGPVTKVKLSPDGNLLVTSEWDLLTDRPRSVRFWDLTAGPPYHSVTLPQSVGTLSLSLTPNWRLLAIGQEDGTARLLRMPTLPATTWEMQLRTMVALGMRASGAEYQSIPPEEWQAFRRELLPGR